MIQTTSFLHAPKTVSFVHASLRVGLYTNAASCCQNAKPCCCCALSFRRPEKQKSTSRGLLLRQLQVNVVHTVRCANALELSDVVCSDLDRVHLVGQVTLNVIAHLRIVCCLCNLVQFGQLQIDKLFELQMEVHGVHRVAGAISLVKGHFRDGNWQEFNLAPSLVLVLHKLVCVGALLQALLIEVLGEAREGDGVSVEVGPNGVVRVHGGVLDVNVAVDGVLLVLGVAVVTARVDGQGGLAALRREDESGEILADAGHVDLAKVDGSRAAGLLLDRHRPHGAGARRSQRRCPRERGAAAGSGGAQTQEARGEGGGSPTIHDDRETRRAGERDCGQGNERIRNTRAPFVAAGGRRSLVVPLLS
jgi:hypothetical protein